MLQPLFNTLGSQIDDFLDKKRKDPFGMLMPTNKQVQWLTEIVQQSATSINSDLT
jgi:hypothetical protein